MTKLKILVCGAAGKMGLEVVKAVKKEADLELVACVDVKDIGTEMGGIEISGDLAKAIASSKPDVAIDFTHPSSAMNNAKIILNSKVNAIIGTTGFTEENLTEIKNLCSKNGVNAIVAPNFAIGAVLMMNFAKAAAKHMPQVEIIEMHHDQKADAPSGTAIKTAELILEEEAAKDIRKPKIKEIEKLDGARGASLEGIHIHSIRLPGFVAHQEVIFGGLGQTLTIRHDSISRESFMPGVIMAVRKIKELKGLTYGLEKLL